MSGAIQFLRQVSQLQKFTLKLRSRLTLASLKTVLLGTKTEKTAPVQGAIRLQGAEQIADTQPVEVYTSMPASVRFGQSVRIP